MKSKKVVVISIIAVLVVAVLIASYVLIVMPKKGETVTSEEVAKVSEGEKAQTGEVSTEGWNLDRVNIVYDTENVPVPVPKGYVASGVDGEHTVNDGFVIYEGESEVTDSNKDEAQKTRNQWVWVPIYDLSEIYGVDSAGMMHGKLYEFDEDGRRALNWTEDNGVMKVSDTSYSREPDVVTSYDNDSTLPFHLAEEERKELDIELKEQFKTTIESIKKYGGFYIGRYETGGLSGEAKVTKINTGIGDQKWYTMFEKSKELRGKNSNVRTNMIWGCLWDATLEWLVDSGEKAYSEVGEDSSGWGNYYNCTSSFTYITTSGGTATKGTTKKTRIPTGSAEYTKANNIYDMAGNVSEWTLEANSTGNRGLRGGYYDYNGSSYPADCRTNLYPATNTLNIGFRATLYVAL